MNGAWVVAAVLVPLLTAPGLLIVERFRPHWQRPLALAAILGSLAVALRLLLHADAGAIEVYLLGNWPAPFGIVLVLDRLAALMLLLTAIVALASLLCGFACVPRGPHFLAFILFALAGVNGAFLTGDLFNLFVFFEVLLIASYALLLHDAGGRALRAGLHFVVINLVGSALFLVAVSLLYGVAGSLNMADLALRLAHLPAHDAGLARAAAMLLLLVFALKAAILPLGFWLPETYGAAPGPVAVLFAVMTKVGIYGIVRVSMLLFGGSDAAMTGWGAVALVALGLATVAFGAVAALAASRLTALIGALVLVSSGTLVAASALGGQALAGALYYLVHSTLVVGLLFLLADIMARQRGAVGDRLRTGPPLAQSRTLGWLFLAGAAMFAGVPPFSGFIGKTMMLRATLGVPGAAWFWAAVLASGAISVIALARAGTRMLWKTRGDTSHASLAPGDTAALTLLVAALMLWALGAGPALHYAMGTAAQLTQPALYIDATVSAARTGTR